MAINRSQQGFALLIAVIFVSVMLAFALLIGTLGYKQSILANSAINSQYAFYAADAALECILELEDAAGLTGGALTYAEANDAAPAPALPCAGVSRGGTIAKDSTVAVFTYRFDIAANRCVDLTVYKYRVAQNGRLAYFFSQGYSTSCSNVGGAAPYAVRGIQHFY